MPTQSERYMRARMQLNEAMETFIEESLRADFPIWSIANSIMDSAYDANSMIHGAIIGEAVEFSERQ